MIVKQKQVSYKIQQCSVKKLEKYLHVPCTSYFFALLSFQIFTSPLSKIKLHLLSTVQLSVFKAPQELWNLLSKAVLGKFHGSVQHSKCNYLQDRANFLRSRAWRIVLICNIATMYLIQEVKPQNYSKWCNPTRNLLCDLQHQGTLKAIDGELWDGEIQTKIQNKGRQESPCQVQMIHRVLTQYKDVILPVKGIWRWRSGGHLIFTMRFTSLVRWHMYNESSSDVCLL